MSYIDRFWKNLFKANKAFATSVFGRISLKFLLERCISQGRTFTQYDWFIGIMLDLVLKDFN